LWGSFWELVQLIKATRRAPSPEIRKLHVLIKLLLSRFRAIYDRAKVGRRELRIISDLSSSVSQFTTDAVFTLIVQIQLAEVNRQPKDKRNARNKKRRAKKPSA
jgi:hypothetical protein